MQRNASKYLQAKITFSGCAFKANFNAGNGKSDDNAELGIYRNNCRISLYRWNHVIVSNKTDNVYQGT